MNQLVQFVVLALAVAPWANAFPAYRSLGGLSNEHIETLIPRFHVAPPETPPGPLNVSCTKLVYDGAHPFRAPGPRDTQGPCPALNTLANHGYLPRDGIVTPAQIINAAQEGFNMANVQAGFLAYAGLLVGGNPITNLVSIGGHSHRTGKIPGIRVAQDGLSSVGTEVEGDASLTRADAFFGDNHSFNETLWEEFVDFCNRFGAGKYNLTVAAELRYHRIQQSIATNPNFELVNLRFNTVYFSAVFPLNLFIDGRHTDGQLDLDTALSFFRDARYPKGFFRSSKPLGHEGTDAIFAAHPILPGRNMGKVNTYTPDPTSSNLTTPCKMYENFVNNVVLPIYPSPRGVLREALKRNLGYLHHFADPSCTQIFPYGL